MQATLVHAQMCRRGNSDTKKLGLVQARVLLSQHTISSGTMRYPRVDWRTQQRQGQRQTSPEQKERQAHTQVSEQQRNKREGYRQRKLEANKNSASLSLTRNIHRASVRGATLPLLRTTRQKSTKRSEKRNLQTLWGWRAAAQIASGSKPTIQTCSHRQAVETAQHFRTHALTAWCQPLTHHERRDSRENQLLLPPAEESVSSHVSTFRSASNKEKVGGVEMRVPLLLADRLPTLNFGGQTCMQILLLAVCPICWHPQWKCS